MSLNPRTYWAVKAFLQVQAALMAEIASPSGEYISEDYVRSAMLRGLILADPANATQVEAEMEAWWSGALSVVDGVSKALGSPIRHDVGVKPFGAHRGIACEVKWLKQQKKQAVLADIWKLVLSRSTLVEGEAMRALLLVGGESEAFEGTLRSLDGESVRLRWSSKGRRLKPDKKKKKPLARGLPAGTLLNLGTLVNRSVAAKTALMSLLGWAGGKHYRTPPATHGKFWLTCRARWWLTVGNRSWRAVLWELDAHGIKAQSTIDWQNFQNELKAEAAKNSAKK